MTCSILYVTSKIILSPHTRAQNSKQVFLHRRCTNELCRTRNKNAQVDEGEVDRTTIPCLQEGFAGTSETYMFGDIFLATHFLGIYGEGRGRGYKEIWVGPKQGPANL